MDAAGMTKASSLKTSRVKFQGQKARSLLFFIFVPCYFFLFLILKAKSEKDTEQRLWEVSIVVA
jgi:hypothetical protein